MGKNTLSVGTKLCVYILVVSQPSNFQVTYKVKELKQAMEEELAINEKNETWELVNKPKNKQVMGVKLVHRVKLNVDGSTNKHKTRLFIKGYSQHPRIDYSDTFSTVARMDTIKILITLTW